MLNYPTLLLVLVGFTALTTLLLVAVALSSDALAEQRLWAMGNVAACLGFAIGTSTALPDLVHGGVSYGFMGLGLALILRGLRQFCGDDLPWPWIIGISVLAFLLPAYYVQVQPSLTSRLVVSGLYLGLLNLACAITLWRGLQGSIRAVMWICAGGFSVLGLALILRAVYLLVTPMVSNNAQTTDTVMGITIFMVSMAQVSIAFGLIMLVSHRYAERLNRLTLLDGLTGALNRVGMERIGRRVLTRARQSHRSVSVAMVDADFFKAINDTRGHPAGDQVLIHLSNMLTTQVRPGDLVIRYGGEEFLLILDGSDAETALRVAQRLRGLIEESCITTDSGEIRYKVSIGVSCTAKTGYALDQLIVDADAALYRAKQEGRNRVCMG